MSNFSAKNKDAYHNYFILDRYEAGVVLTGAEVKAIRAGRVDLKGSYAKIIGSPKAEIFWVGGYIKAGENPDRSRKLLLNRKEIDSLMGKVREKGLTAVVLELYFKKGKVKLSIATAKGKKLHDKRRELKKKDMERDLRKGER